MYRSERCLLDDAFMELTVAIFLTQGLVSWLGFARARCKTPWHLEGVWKGGLVVTSWLKVAEKPACLQGVEMVCSFAPFCVGQRVGPMDLVKAWQVECFYGCKPPEY